MQLGQRLVVIGNVLENVVTDDGVETLVVKSDVGDIHLAHVGGEVLRREIAGIVINLVRFQKLAIKQEQSVVNRFQDSRILSEHSLVLKRQNLD